MKIKKVLLFTGLVGLSLPAMASCGGVKIEAEEQEITVGGETMQVYTIDGHYYRDVKCDNPITSAQAIKNAELAGGHLITCQKEDEFKLALALSKLHNTEIAMGAVKNPLDETMYWVTGEKVEKGYKKLNKLLKEQTTAPTESSYFLYELRANQHLIFGKNKIYCGAIIFDEKYAGVDRYIIEWDAYGDINAGRKFDFFAPKEVSTEDQFIDVVNKGYIGGVKLKNDITFTKKVFFNKAIPIDGNGHTLTFMDNSAGGNGTYLFAKLDKDVVVQNLTVVHNVESAPNDYIGGFVKDMFGTMQNVTYKGSVKATSNAAKSRMGGLALNAYNGSSFINCTNEADLFGGHDIGGIFAAAETGIVVRGCKNTGNIEGLNSLGGIGGKIIGKCSTEVYDCVNEGNIKGGKEVGGIIGRVTMEHKSTNLTDPNFYDHLKFENCDNKGDIVGTESVGGCFGAVHGESNVFMDLGVSHCNVYLTNCKNHGTVNGKTQICDKEKYFGNIVGLFYADGAKTKAEDCLIEGVQTTYVGHYEKGSCTL